MRLNALNKFLLVLAKISADQSTNQAIEVINLQLNTKTTYHSIRFAAKVLALNRRYLVNYIYLNQIKPIISRFLVKNKEEPVLKKLNVQITARKTEVTDLSKGVITNFSSLSSVAKALGLRQASISLYLKENCKKPFKNRYIFKLILD